MTLAGLCTKIFLALNQFPCQTRIRSLPGLVSNSLSHCSLIELIDVTLADEDAFSKVVDTGCFFLTVPPNFQYQNENDGQPIRDSVP